MMGENGAHKIQVEGSKTEREGEREREPFVSWTTKVQNPGNIFWITTTRAYPTHSLSLVLAHCIYIPFSLSFSLVSIRR